VVWPGANVTVPDWAPVKSAALAPPVGNESAHCTVAFDVLAALRVTTNS